MSGGIVAVGGVGVILLLLTAVVVTLAVPVSALLWYFGYVQIEVVVGVLVLAQTVTIVFGGANTE